MNTESPQPAQNGEQPLLLQFFNGLRKEIDSPFNEWVTGEKVGHSPTQEEKLVHFVASGGAREYRRKFFLTHQVPALAA